jgi:hypothetical protein
MISHVGGGGIPPRFSPGMTPDQLEQWLLHEYGDAYKNDISKVKGKRLLLLYNLAPRLLFQALHTENLAP